MRYEKIRECLMKKLTPAIVEDVVEFANKGEVDYERLMDDLTYYYLGNKWAYRVNKESWYVDGHNALLALYNYFGYEHCKPDKLRKFTVYKRTGPNGKVYVGLTSKTPEERAGEHGWGYKDNPKLFNDILKYGWEEFKTEVIADKLTPEDADKLETDMIRALNCVEEGYNNDDKQ